MRIVQEPVAHWGGAVDHWLLTGPVLDMLRADDSNLSLQWLCHAPKAAVHSPFLYLSTQSYEMFPEPSGVV